MENGDKLILVTGASGYIAGKLIPRLLAQGYPVRCMVRTEAKLAVHSWRDQVEVVCADVSDQTSLPPALEGVHSAYYLIHNMSSGQGYHQIEMQGARNFAQAAQSAGVEHILYLGGLADPQADIAPHMRSRIETGDALRQYQVPVTEFRAGVIVGPGSISFEMIRYLAEKLPILVGPPWLKNKTQPISANNVVDYLLAGLETPVCQGKVFEIGGPDVMPYLQTMTGYCRARRLRRPALILPFVPIALMAYLVGLMTPVQRSIARPLIGGLKSASVVSDRQALAAFPEIEPLGFEEALAQSLAQLHPACISRGWRATAQNDRCILSEGFLIHTLKTQIQQPVQTLYPRLMGFTQTYNQFEIETTQKNTVILLKDKYKKNGMSWIEWELLPAKDNTTILRQTGYFAPRGLPGFLSRPLWLAELRKIFGQVQNISGKT